MLRYFVPLFFLFVLALDADNRGLKLRKAPPPGEQKTALIIGNADYQSQKPLKNPVNDSRAIRDNLKNLGFHVLYLENAERREMVRTIDTFLKALDSSSVGLVYFAGHGLEVDGENYLVPLHAEIKNETDIKYEAIAVNQLIEDMQQTRSRFNIMILDACRDNPYKRLKRGGSSGLANVEAEGFFIAFATAPGKTAQDGRGNHGLFTKHFLKNINQKGVPLHQVFRNVRREVYLESNKEQLPLVRNGIALGEFYFIPPDADAPSPLEPVETFQPTIKPNRQRYALTVSTDPADAAVYITNIAPKYHDGIMLPPGGYRIKIAKVGYKTQIDNINLESDLNLHYRLDPIRQKTYQKAGLISSYDEDWGTMFLEVDKKRVHVGDTIFVRTMGGKYLPFTIEKLSGAKAAIYVESFSHEWDKNIFISR